VLLELRAATGLAFALVALFDAGLLDRGSTG
jgi:hypothetical protein